jgi:IS30 family transposase
MDTDKKRLSAHDKITLQALILKEDSSLSSCAKRLGCDKSTIYRELKRYCVVKVGARSPYRCSNGANCLESKDTTSFKCSECSKYKEVMCDKLKRFPYVCNTCNSKAYCLHTKKYYDFEVSVTKSAKVKVKSRQRISLSAEEIKEFTDILLKGFNNGQSINHIYQDNEKLHKLSQRSIRRYIHNGYINIPLYKLPMIRHRDKGGNRPQRRAIRQSLIGRLYSDFSLAKTNNKLGNVIQIDSVEGKREDKQCLLTIFIPEMKFMIARLYKRSSSATSVKDTLFELLSGGPLSFVNSILTDNGVEFQKITELETNGTLNNLKIYFCDPYCSWQKGSIEKNHEFIRKIIKKGVSLDGYTQDDIDLLFSHINSYHRDSLKETPYQLFKDRYGVSVLNKLGIKEIEASNVNLSPSLLRGLVQLQ